jgi:serine/threonine protein kinase
MSSSTSRKVGPWTLREQIGEGGNGTVWVAAREHSETEVALKIIKTHNVKREQYQRFVREITFLQEHATEPGVLPLIEAYLPVEPNSEDQPWLATQIATPLAKALAGKSLPDIVHATEEIGRTLARLQAEFNVAHRDIKPGNLYELDGSCLIGDFGLVTQPEDPGLTTDGRQVGPAHYTAYEMITSPTSADPHPADVYSLGKTLWVLATGQTYPPEGHQPADTRGFSIGDFRPHPRSHALDDIVDRTTRLHPTERPSKEQVANDLAAWQELAQQPLIIDLSAQSERLRAKLAPVITEQDRVQRNKNLAYQAVRRYQELVTPLNDQLKNAYPGTQVDNGADKITTNIVRSGRGHAQSTLFRWHRCTVVKPLDRVATPALRMGRSVELFDDGTIILCQLVFVGPEGVMGNIYSSNLPEHSAPVGTTEAEKMIELSAQELASVLKIGVEALINSLPDAAD